MNNDYQLQEQDEHQQWLVYGKLQKARVLLQEKPLKKSGYNKFQNYKYYQLDDFLPSINIIFDNLGLCSVFSINDDMATLRIFDSEFGGVIIFRSPIADANSGKSLPIQALGSQHTYLRRYLLLNALEITEHDAIDAEDNKEYPKSSQSITTDEFNKLSKKQQDELRSYAIEPKSLLAKKDVAGAIKYIEDLELEATMQTAFWHLFESSERSIMKKHKESK